MKKGLVIIGVIAVIAVGTGLALSARSKEETSQAPETTSTQPTTSQSEQKTNSTDPQSATKIAIKNFSYQPATLTVKKGTAVTWTNEDNVAHTVTSDSGNELESKSLGKGDSFTHTFNTTGTFAYHCSPHPTMKASVVVTE
jgi:plastocyanin